MASILVPVAYLIVLVGALLVFSRIYRKRAASKFRESGVLAYSLMTD
jgi:translocation protein SEC66